MPRYEDVIGSFMSNRDDGDPQKPEVPGASMRPSEPSGPNPPSVTRGRNGRPPNPPMRGQSVGRNERDPETMEDQKHPESMKLSKFFSRMPTRSELLDLPPGTTAETPWGTVGDDGELVFSPEGEEKYKEEMVKARSKFGPTPFADDPNAPQFDVKLGRQFINPFTGSWGRY